MNDLIQITQTQINGTEVNSVNARELHKKLELKSDFSTWIKRELELFTESVDYIRFHKKVEANNATLIEYIVTLDTAKHLSMLQRNAKGKEVRDYFISIEKKAQKVLTTSEQIALLAQGHQDTEKRISALEETKRLENWQERSLHDAKNKKVYEIAQDDKEFATKLHRRVWSLFKKQFHLPRYNELPAIRFNDGLEFINNLSIADMVI